MVFSNIFSFLAEVSEKATAKRTSQDIFLRKKGRTPEKTGTLPLF